jgi:hypothetical protein
VSDRPLCAIEGLETSGSGLGLEISAVARCVVVMCQ